MTITNVALAGATGNLGSALLKGLTDGGFKVTAITREGSKHTFPSGVTAVPVNYESIDSLTKALKGQDAVVSALGNEALEHQPLLIKAAGQAGVQRFIPSEFGANTVNPKVAGIPIFGPKLVAVGALLAEAKAGTLSYTRIFTGPFLDFGIKAGFIFNLKEKNITLYDGGDRIFSTASLPTIGKAVAGVLKHPEETKNRGVYVQDAALTLKDLAAAGKKAVGEEGWTENVVPVEALLDGAWKELAKHEPEVNALVFPFLAAALWGEGYGNHYLENDNKLLGIKELNTVEVEKLVKSLA